jgi:hypothetical protein
MCAGGREHATQRERKYRKLWLYRGHLKPGEVNIEVRAAEKK